MDNASIWFSCFSDPIISKPPWIFAFSNTRHFASWMRLHYGQNTLPGKAVLRDNVLFLYAMFRFKDILMEWNGLTLLKEVIFCVFLFPLQFSKLYLSFYRHAKQEALHERMLAVNLLSRVAGLKSPKRQRECVFCQNVATCDFPVLQFPSHSFWNNPKRKFKCQSLTFGGGGHENFSSFEWQGEASLLGRMHIRISSQAGFPQL